MSTEHAPTKENKNEIPVQAPETSAPTVTLTKAEMTALKPLIQERVSGSKEKVNREDVKKQVIEEAMAQKSQKQAEQQKAEILKSSITSELESKTEPKKDTAPDKAETGPIVMVTTPTPEDKEGDIPAQENQITNKVVPRETLRIGETYTIGAKTYKITGAHGSNVEAIDIATGKPAFPNLDQIDRSIKDRRNDIMGKFYDKFGISGDQYLELEKNEDFANLSYGQKLFMLKGMENLALDKVKYGANQKIKERIAETSTLKIWKKEFWKNKSDSARKTWLTSKEEQEILKDIRKGGLEENGEFVRQMIARTQAMDVPMFLNEHGQIEMELMNLGDTENPEAKAIARKYNQAGSQFAMMPQEWSLATARNGEHRRYTESKKAYEKMRDALAEQTKGDLSVTKQDFQNDNKIRLAQLMASHPEAEKELIAISGVMGQLGTNFRKNAGIQKAALFALGYTGRRLVRSQHLADAAQAILPLAFLGSAFGGIRGWMRGAQKLKEDEMASRRGVETAEQKNPDPKKPGTGKNFVRSFDIERTLEDGTKKKDLGLAEKLERLVTQYESENDPETQAAIAKLIQARVTYSKSKINDGLINFGDDSNRLINQNRFISALSRAEMLSWSANPKNKTDLENRLESILSIRKDAIENRQMKYKATKATIGVIAGSAAALGGYYLADALGEAGHYIQGKWRAFDGKEAMDGLTRITNWAFKGQAYAGGGAPNMELLPKEAYAGMREAGYDAIRGFDKAAQAVASGAHKVAGGAQDVGDRISKLYNEIHAATDGNRAPAHIEHDVTEHAPKLDQPKIDRPQFDKDIAHAESTSTNLKTPTETPELKAEAELPEEIKPTTPKAEALIAKPVKIEVSSKGGIESVRQLKNKLIEDYKGVPLEKMPKMVREIITTDETVMSEKLGLFKPGQINESAMLRRGSVLELDEQGNVSLGGAGEKEATILAYGDERESAGYEGKMFDYNGIHSQPTAPVAASPADEHIVNLKQNTSGEYVLKNGNEVHVINHPKLPTEAEVIANEAAHAKAEAATKTTAQEIAKKPIVVGRHITRGVSGKGMSGFPEEAYAARYGTAGRAGYGGNAHIERGRTFSYGTTGNTNAVETVNAPVGQDQIVTKPRFDDPSLFDKRVNTQFDKLMFGTFGERNPLNGDLTINKDIAKFLDTNLATDDVYTDITESTDENTIHYYNIVKSIHQKCVDEKLGLEPKTGETTGMYLKEALQKMKDKGINIRRFVRELLENEGNPAAEAVKAAKSEEYLDDTYK